MVTLSEMTYYEGWPFPFVLVLWVKVIPLFKENVTSTVKHVNFISSCKTFGNSKKLRIKEAKVFMC